MRETYLKAKPLKSGGVAWEYRLTIPADVRHCFPNPKTGKPMREFSKYLGRVSRKSDALRIAEALYAHDKARIDAARGVDPARLTLIAQAEETARHCLRSPTDRSHWEDHAVNEARDRGRGVQALSVDETIATFGTDRDKTILNALRNRGTFQPDRVTLRDAYERDLRLYGVPQGRSEDHFPVAIDQFISVNGELDILDLRRDHAVAWVTACRNSGTQNDATIGRRMACLSGVYSRWMRDHNLPKLPLFEGMGLKKSGKSDCLPFHELKTAMR